MKRMSEFDSLEDFGYKAGINDEGKVEYVKCDADFETITDALDTSIVYSNGDLTPGKFFTLDTILSGGAINVNYDDAGSNEQAELALDYSVATSLAFLGSVYSTVMIAVNKIKDNYPNGLQILDSVTGVNTIMFDNTNIYLYGSPTPTSISDYTDYELIEIYNGSLNATFEIYDSSITGGTYSLLFLDGQPMSGALYEHHIQPKQPALDKFYGSLSSYELDLLVPPAERTNYYPRHPIATQNIFFQGVEYDSFLETELGWASEADEEEANFVWRKLYPDGQKNLDSDDGIMQKMVLTIAHSYDKIKNYQDQMKYQQHIGYSQSNHISKDLVELLANQWNWMLGHNLKQDDYSEYIYSQYENYITGQSQQRLSAKDVNFEMWRRILSNIVTLYKKKGTREAIKYVANMYGLPEALLWIEELVAVASSSISGEELIESESNIVVPIAGRQWYINELGSATTLDYHITRNTKYLSINISPFDAIEFDFFDWGWENHPDIIGVNGVSVEISGSTELTKAQFFAKVIRNTIKSDGSARYEESYPLLEREADYYYDISPNQFSLATLEPYMDFLDDNWNILISNLVPASSKLISIGTLYRNPMWHREKHQWTVEYDLKSLPFNEVVEVPNFVPVMGVQLPHHPIIDPVETPAEAYINKIGEMDPVVIDGAHSLSKHDIMNDPQYVGSVATNMNGIMDSSEYFGIFISAATDSDAVDYEYSGSILTIDSPFLESISGNQGTLILEDYTTDALIVSNENVLNIVFSAGNLSDSGYSKIEASLFKKQEDEAVVVDTGKTYSIMSVEYEDNTYGRYRVSSVEHIDEFDFIEVDSDYLPYINGSVQVVYIDSGTSQIRTKPAIGLFNLPIGVNNDVVDWFEYMNSGSLDHLRVLHDLGGFSYSEMIQGLDIIGNYLDETGDLTDVSQFASWAYSFEQTTSLIIQLWVWFFHQPIAMIYGSQLILEYVKREPSWNLSSPAIALINNVAANQTKATFQRVINFFNWKIPEQSLSWDNFLNINEGWDFPTIDTEARGEDNNYSTTGFCSIGGLNYLNAPILQDGCEYFLRTRMLTHAPKSWGRVSGMLPFPIIESGGTILDSGYDLSYINDIKYYGRYFTFLLTPKVPNGSTYNVLQTGTFPLTSDASVSVKWDGVGDSSRLEIQYLSTGTTAPYVDAVADQHYVGITNEEWELSGITINIDARDGVGDDYIYTLQTTLEPDTYYWWRIKNFKSKINTFGHNLEYFTTNEPQIFLTGGFEGGGHHDGEVQETAEAPEQGGGGTRFFPELG